MQLYQLMVQQRTARHTLYSTVNLLFASREAQPEKQLDDMYRRFGTVNKCNGWTDRLTDRSKDRQ